MDGLGNLVGNGISSLVSTAVGAIGAGIDGVVHALSTAVPGGMLAVVVVLGLLGSVWFLARR